MPAPSADFPAAHRLFRHIILSDTRISGGFLIKLRAVGFPALFRAISVRDKIIILTLSVVFSGSLAFWLGALYLSSTETVPDIGGSYSEGIVGQPRYVNPVLSSANGVDEDIVNVVYAGLTGHDADGRVIDRLADRIEVSEDGKTYTAHIRNDATFHDGEPVLADDVLFTISVIQDSAYKSPLRQKWQGISAVPVDDRTVSFTLTKPYFGFREHLSVGILPKHVWQDVAPDRFALTDLNLMPIGAGPYRFFDYQKDANGNILSYELRAFPEYYDGEPNITKLTFAFYPDEDSVVRAYGNREVLGMAPMSVDRAIPFVGAKGVDARTFRLPRMFAVFFNPVKSVPLAYAEVRRALTLSVSREDIVRDALSGRGIETRSPFLPFMVGEPAMPDVPENVDEANRILDEAGWGRGDDGIRRKDDTRLVFALSVPDWPELRTTADMLREQWSRVGAEVNVEVRPISDLYKESIRTRSYDALLYGEEMGIDPDFYSFWHSSETKDPGLNLAMFDDSKADEILLSLREEGDPSRRGEKLGELLGIFADKHPATFLFTPDVLYVVSDTVKGWDVRSANAASSRFIGIEDWFVKTKRVFR